MAHWEGCLPPRSPIGENIIPNADDSMSGGRLAIARRRRRRPVNTVSPAESSAEDSDRLAGRLKSGYNRRVN